MNINLYNVIKYLFFQIKLCIMLKQKALIDLQHDGAARDVYSAEKLCTFWFKMLKSYSIIAETVVRVPTASYSVDLAL